MKAPFIVLFASLLTLCTTQPAPAALNEFSTTNRIIAVTNVSSTAEIRPLAAYVIFPTPATGTVSISRVTRGIAVPLARHGFTNVSALTWLPPADYPLRRGDSLAVSSTVARFTLQLESSNVGGDVIRIGGSEWYDDGLAFAPQSSGGGSTQVTVTNAPQFSVTNSQQVVVTNNIVVTNAITVTTGGAGGPQFTAGAGGEYVATNALSLAAFGLSSLDVSAVLDWDGWVDFSGYFAVPAKSQGGSPMRAGEILFDAGEGANGKFYGYRNDAWHAFVMDDEGGGASTPQGPWTNDVNAAAHSLIDVQYVGFNSYNLQLYGASDPNGQQGITVWDGDNSRYAWYYGSSRADGSPNAAGDVLTVDSSGRWYASAPSGGGGSYIPTLGPWTTTNDFGAELRFVAGEMSAKLEGTVSGGGTWYIDGPTLALGNTYNAGNGNVLLQMGAVNEGDFTVTLASGAVLTLDDTVGSKAAVLKGSYDEAGSAVEGFELSASKLTLRNHFNAGINPVSIEVDTNGDIKFNDFANTDLLLKNIVRWVSAPSTASDTGTAGDAAYDGSFLYVCVAANTWLRTAIATW